MIQWALIVSLIVLYFAYEKRKKDFKLVYFIATRNMISDEHGISINFEGTKCTKLSRTRIIINNLGNCNLHNIDISNGIRITPNLRNEILKFNIVSGSQYINNAQYDKNSISFNIEELSPQNEIIFDIYHTGVSNLDLNLYCSFTDRNHQIERQEYLTSLTRESFKISPNTALKSLYWSIIAVFVFKITGVITYVESVIPYIKNWLSPYMEYGIIFIVVYLFSFAYINYKYWTNLKYVKDL